MDGVPWLFWFVAAAIAVAVAATLVRALLRGGHGAGDAAQDMAVYRDQLAEIERDLARGVLTEAEAERTRIEVSRRLLAADRAHGAAGAQSGPRRATWAAAAGIAVAVLLGGTLLYTQLGAPGYGDLPLQGRIAMLDAQRAERPSQAAAEAGIAPAPSTDVPDETVELIDRLRAAAESRPDDMEGQRLLARYEARLGNFPAAHAAQRRMIEAKGDAATAEDWASYAELLVLAAGGYVSPEAEAALQAVLVRDPGNGLARYYSGLMFAQSGRDDLAFRLWRELLEASAPDAPWVQPIRQTLPGLAERAGIRYEPPPLPEAGGPSAADVAAAQDMDPEAREEMIRGMVAGLADRLATSGGPAQDWARLIASLGVLGETDRARAIAYEARSAFQGHDDALALIADAEAQAGIAE